MSDAVRTRPGITQIGIPDEAALRRERSILLACGLDFCIIGPYLAIGIAANSLTLIGESLRGGLMVVLELVLWVVMRRIHRGRTTQYDYGVGKLEQFANLGIGVAMGACGLWLIVAALERWWWPAEQAGLGLVLASVAAFANLALNAVALRALWTAGRDGTSAIMTVQIRSRAVKLLSSGLVALTITVNAVAENIGGLAWVGPLAEALGSGFVGLVMVQLAVSLWREAVPHLLDRSLDDARQASINRALAAHFTDYEALLGVRSRIAGREARVDITLGFDAARSMGEVQLVADAVSAELVDLIPGSVVTVTPVAMRG